MKTESSRETSLKKDHGAKSRHEGTSVGGGARQPMVASGGQGMGRDYSREKKDKMEGDKSQKS